MTETVADEIARALVRHGVKMIFGQSNPTALLLAAERLGIRQLLYRTENAAGYMCDAYSRVSGHIGVIAAQNGPAASLMVAPMAEALKASIPMLVLVQEVPASHRDRNAFQELDHFALFAGVSKWTRRLDDPNRASEYVDLAMVAANSGRPGPVVLLLAKDMLTQLSCDGSVKKRVQNLGTFPLDRPRPERVGVEAAAAMIASARSPLLIAGGGVHASFAAQELVALAERAVLPVATTNMGKGAIAEDHPLSLGVAGNLVGKGGPIHEYKDLVAGADVILMVGCRTNENGTDSWRLTDPEATYIHIDLDSQEVGRNYESLRLVGDARSALVDLAEVLQQLDLSKRKLGEAALKERIGWGRALRAAEIADQMRSGDTPILPQRLMGDLDAAITAEDIVVADASYSSVWVTGYLAAKKHGQRFITPRGLAGLGWGMPYAMGAKLARPAARCVAIVGDGGFAHVWGEIEMAVREQIPIVVVVLNNGQLAMQKHGEQVGFDATTTAIEFSAVDHAAMARAAGANGVRVEAPDDFAPALADALAAERITVIDVITSNDAYAPLGVFDGVSERFAKPIAARPAPSSFSG